MPACEGSSPVFFQAHFDARMIVDSGTGKKKEATQWTPYQKQNSPGAIAGALRWWREVARMWCLSGVAKG